MYWKCVGTVRNSLRKPTGWVPNMDKIPPGFVPFIGERNLGGGTAPMVITEEDGTWTARKKGKKYPSPLCPQKDSNSTARTLNN